MKITNFTLDEFPFLLVEVIRGGEEEVAYGVARYEDVELAIQVKNYLNYKQKQLRSVRKRYFVFDMENKVELT